MERYGGPAALGVLRAGSVQPEHPCAASGGVRRGPHRSCTVALCRLQLQQMLGWVFWDGCCLGCKVAPVTVAMENTLLVKFPAILMCPSLSLGESPRVRRARHSRLRTGQAAATSAGHYLCQAWLLPAFPTGSWHGKVSEDPKWGVWGSMVGMHGMEE